ncbi:MAG: hypothetical protein NT154_43010, partial [Verrucomicrobia bacterium]|nr:hypothetical protein [Verrucomicrobiota bacterium]
MRMLYRALQIMPDCFNSRSPVARMAAVLALLAATVTANSAVDAYQGQNCAGKGDLEYLWLIDRSFDFFHPNPDWQNLSMLYNPDWDCLVEGKSWAAWWVENSYSTTFCSLPFLDEPWLTFVQHSQDNWFRYQGDGKRVDSLGYTGPEGCVANTAHPGGGIYNQADCNWKLHDYTVEHTAAATVMQGELLLISRDTAAIRHYLPNLERACAFMETRRDPKNGLFLAGPAANLTGPGGFCGFLQPDGTYGKGYLSSLSITYLAALDRMVEIFRLLGDKEKQALYEERRQRTRDSLPLLMTPLGHLCHSMETNGTRHGVLGQEKWSYFDSFVNIDAIAHRAADLPTAGRIYSLIAAEPAMRPHAYLIANWPSRDDIYDHYGSRDHDGILVFGMWNNGGAWSHLEGRTLLAYYRLGKYEDVRRSALRSMEWANAFQMDAPLKDFGKTPWFDTKLINLCYDAFAIPAGTVRGLFEYRYLADGLRLYPHVPPFIQEYSQKVPIRFGPKRLTLSIRNGGPNIESLRVNGRRWKITDTDSAFLPYNELPARAKVEIVTTGGWPPAAVTAQPSGRPTPDRRETKGPGLRDSANRQVAALRQFQKQVPTGESAQYARAFLAEAIAAFDAWQERANRDAAGLYADMKPEKREEILRSYQEAASGLQLGLDKLMARYATSGNEVQQDIARSWRQHPPVARPWRNVRAFGRLNSFEPAPDGASMRIEGKPKDSNGWEVPTMPVDTTRYTRMEIVAHGSTNAQISWCLLDDKGVEFAALHWKPTPQADETFR